MSKVADAMRPFGVAFQIFGDLIVGNPGCDFCWQQVEVNRVQHVVDNPATEVFKSDVGLVFTCDDCV